MLRKRKLPYRISALGCCTFNSKNCIYLDIHLCFKFAYPHLPKWAFNDDKFYDDGA